LHNDKSPELIYIFTLYCFDFFTFCLLFHLYTNHSILSHYFLVDVYNFIVILSVILMCFECYFLIFCALIFVTFLFRLLSLYDDMFSSHPLLSVICLACSV